MEKQSSTEIPLVDQQKAWNEWNSKHREGSVGTLSDRQALVILEWCSSLQRTDLDILDLGCGSGWMSERLLKYGRVVATDLADEVIERARARVPEVKFLSGDLFSVDLPASAFDVVVSIEVLSNVADSERFVGRVADLLRPGGLLMMATQNRYVLEHWDEIGDPLPGQVRRWVSTGELRNLLSPRFDVLELISVMPAGNEGLLRMVNSTKLNRLLARLSLEQAVTRAKERLMLGRSLLALARKRDGEVRT